MAEPPVLQQFGMGLQEFYIDIVSAVSTSDKVNAVVGEKKDATVACLARLAPCGLGFTTEVIFRSAKRVLFEGSCAFRGTPFWGAPILTHAPN